MSSAVFIVIAVIAVALLLIGGFVAAVKWLLWVGIILLLLTAISWMIRVVTARR